MTHICVGNLTIIGSDNGLAPSRRQAIIWINAGILLIGPLGTNFNEILICIQAFSFKKMHLKMASAKWRPFCLGHNVLILDLTLGFNALHGDNCKTRRETFTCLYMVCLILEVCHYSNWCHFVVLISLTHWGWVEDGVQDVGQLGNCRVAVALNGQSQYWEMNRNRQKKSLSLWNTNLSLPSTWGMCLGKSRACWRRDVSASVNGC